MCYGFCQISSASYPLYFSVKPFSFFRSIDVHRQNMNRNGANVSPCKTPVTIFTPSCDDSCTFNIHNYSDHINFLSLIESSM